MALPFSFNYSREHSLYVYHYFNDSNQKLVERAWPEKIDENWWHKWNFQPYDKYNVSGMSPVQNAIYLALAWKLTKGLTRFGIPRWTRDDIAKEIGKTFELVRWEYIRGVYQNAWNLIDQGFVHARSNPGPLHKPFIDKWKLKYRNFAGLFRLESFEEFIGIQKPALVDASSEVSYFAFNDPVRVVGFKKALKSYWRPKLANLLGDQDIFINICLGIDIGYPDSILIKTKTDIRPKLESIVKEYQAAIQKFEWKMQEIYEIDEFTNAVSELVSL